MGLPVDTYCILCILKKNLEIARSLGDEKTATAFARELMRAYVDGSPEATAPHITAVASRLFQKYYGLEPDRFREEKEASNRFAMARLEDIRRRVDGAEDRVYAGLQFAILGNYIDFSALHEEVSFEKLDELLDSAQELQVDKDNWKAFCRDLEKGKRLLYLTDNAGEICFDRIFAEKLQEAYPHLEITFCVKGGFAVNDATREDAILAGIPFPVIDNGNCIQGMALDQLSEQAQQALETADVIFSKGQANVETMIGCGYNIYYAFLIKCEKFQKLFQKPQLTPMLIREKDQA